MQQRSDQMEFLGIMYHTIWLDRHRHFHFAIPYYRLFINLLTKNPQHKELQARHLPLGFIMDQEKEKRTDSGQRKWDKASPEEATGRTGSAGGDSYTEGSEKPRSSTTQRGTNHPANDEQERLGSSHTAGEPLKKEKESEWKGGTPSQGPTTGGMGAAGGGHDTDETDVWGDTDRSKK